MCVDSDLGDSDGFFELTNIECYTLRGDPDFVQFNIIAGTESDISFQVRLVKGRESKSIGIPCAREYNLRSLCRYDVFTQRRVSTFL